MSWVQGDENYYATQDTNHGYRSDIWEQRKHLERLITFPNDDDYFSGHSYISNYYQIDEHFQTLTLGSRPQFRGVDGSYHNFGDNDNSSNAFSGNDFDRDIQLLEHELVMHIDMIVVVLHIEVLDIINIILSPNSLQSHIFLIMDHQVNHLSQHIKVINNYFNHILTIQIIVSICMLVVGLMMMMILSSLIIQHDID